MFGKANPSLLPNLNQVDPHALTTPSFSGFTFETIGKQPSLLARISDKRADDLDVASPSSPLSTADYIALPPDSDIDDLAPSVPLDRKSLLQALTNADDAIHPMDVDGDQESQHRRDPLIPGMLQATHSSEGIPVSVARTPQPSGLPSTHKNSSDTNNNYQPSSEFLDLAAAHSPMETTFNLAYPEPEYSNVTQNTSSESIRMSVEHEASNPVLAPASIPTTASAAPPSDDAHTIKILHTQEHIEPAEMLTLHEHVLASISSITATSSTSKADDFEKVIAAFQAVQTQSVSAMSAARRARLLAEQSCDLAKQALVAAEESLDAAEISNRRFLEVSETLDICSLQESDRKKLVELEALKTDITSLGDRLQIYTSKIQSKLASAAKPSPSSTLVLVERAVSPIHSAEVDNASKGAVKSTISSKRTVAGKQQKVQKIARVHDLPSWAPEAEADIARRAWEAERELSARRSLPPAEISVTSNPSGNSSTADFAQDNNERPLAPVHHLVEPLSVAAPKSPQPMRRSERDIILTEKVQYEPVTARRLLGDRRQMEKKVVEDIEDIASLTTLTLPAPSTITPVGPAPRFGNPVAHQTLLSFSPLRSNVAKPTSMTPGPSQNNLNRSTFSTPVTEASTSALTSRPRPPSAVNSDAGTKDPRERPQPLAKDPKDLSNAVCQGSSVQVRSEDGNTHSSILPSKPAVSPTDETINLLPNLSTVNPGVIIRDHVYPSEETDSTMSSSSPLVYCTRQSPERGNLPYEPIDLPLSANSQICNTKHLLGRRGVQWQTKLAATSTAKEELSNDQSTALISGSGSQSLPDSSTPHALSIVIPNVRAERVQAAITPSRSEADYVLPTPKLDSYKATPSSASASAVVDALNQGFIANGDLQQKRTPPAAPRNLTPALAPSPSEYTPPVSAGQKRKLNEKELSPFSAKPKPFKGKRSRQDDSRSVPSSQIGGDHWSPRRSLPPSPSRNMPFAQRIGRAADCYRPQYDDQHDERIYNRSSPPPISSWTERRLEEGSRDVPDLASRMSEPAQYRGRGKQRGGAGAGSHRGGRRGTADPPRARLGSGGLESRISDPQTSLGNRIGS